MKTTAWWRLLVAFLIISCGPQLGTADLSVEFLDRAAVAAGRKSTVIVTATGEDGTIGSGSVRLVSTAGTLTEGADAVLDAYGRARFDFSCDRAIDAGCVDSVKLTAKWTRAGKTPVSGEVTVSITAGGGTGAGTGASDGTTAGGTGGTGGSGDLCATECSNNPNFLYLQTLKAGHVTNGWGPTAAQLVSTTATSSSVQLAGATCSGNECSKVALGAAEPTYPNAPSSIVYLLGTSTSGISFGGSVDVPVIRLQTYTDGKRQPPVNYQPYFDLSACGGFPNITTFTVCSLDVSGGVVRQAHVRFNSICYGSPGDISVRGCVRYTQ